VRISPSFSFKALSIAALLLATSQLPVPAQAQDEGTKSDTEAPADATNFGPRKKALDQKAAAEGPKAEVISTHGKWQVQCTEVGAGGDENGGAAGKSCGIIQNVKSEKNENIAISLVISRVKRGDKAATFFRVFAPIGVYLPTGIPVEIDGAALPNRMQFTRCLPRICEGFAEATPESLNKFKKGNAATFYIYDRPGNGFPMKVSLEGFGAALAALNKL
jgi:invasion protein IalB